MMALFSSKRNPQDLFDPATFTVTDVVFEPPAFMLSPSIYRDAPRRRWAVCFRGAEPAVFSNADIVECALVEDQADEKNGALSGKGLLWRIVSNPSEVSRANAAKRGMCTGMGLVVAVRTKDGVSRLELPIITREIRRDSPMFARMIEFAQQVESKFYEMKAEA